MLEILYLVKVLTVHDGDTFKIDLPCEIKEVCKSVPIRLFGVDAPEMTDKRVDIRVLAMKSKTRLAELLNKKNKIEIKILKRDKYFRLLADVYSNGENVTDLLLKEDLVRLYNGTGAKPW